MYVDSHIHLSHASYGGSIDNNGPAPCIVSSYGDSPICHYNRGELIEALKKDGIEFCVEPGISAESNEILLELAARYNDFIYPAVGVHPTRTPGTRLSFLKELENLSEDPSVVAIGELGLDYHHPRHEQHRLKQKLWVIKQLKLADKRKLPLILHIRLADSDAIRILRRYRKKIHGGVCHCFTSGPDIARIYTEELNLMLGIGGSLLQKNCADLEEAVKNTDISYLLLETDGPYVKPEKPDGVSGKQWTKARNTSFIIKDVAKKVAELKNMDISEVERITTENARRLFNIHNNN